MNKWHCIANTLQMNEKYKLFKPGQTIVDLVCALHIVSDVRS